MLFICVGIPMKTEYSNFNSTIFISHNFARELIESIQKLNSTSKFEFNFLLNSLFWVEWRAMKLIQMMGSAWYRLVIGFAYPTVTVRGLSPRPPSTSWYRGTAVNRCVNYRNGCTPNRLPARPPANTLPVYRYQIAALWNYFRWGGTGATPGLANYYLCQSVSQSVVYRTFR